MSEEAAGRRLPPLATLIASGLVVLGILLFMFVEEGLLVLAGLGAFGPGILRETGWLRDHDEFQRQTAHRAGYHAYLIGGLAAVLVVSALRRSGSSLEASAEWVTLILVLLWITWLFSTLLAYWGAQKTASRVLLTFGSFWAVFVVASLIGEPAEDAREAALGMLMAILVVAPFFGLAWMAGRRPRLAGLLLLGVAATLFVVLLPTWGSRSLDLSTILVTASLLLVPLLASGIALLREGAPHAPDGDKWAEPGAVAPGAG